MKFNSQGTCFLVNLESKKTYMFFGKKIDKNVT